MPAEEQPPPWRPTSPWLLGALLLAWLVALSVVLGSPALAVSLWIITVGMGFLILAKGRRMSHGDHGGAKELPAFVRSPSLGVRDELPTVLTAEEAAALLRVDQRLIVDAIQSRKLPGNSLGNHWRVRTQALFEWLDGYNPP